MARQLVHYGAGKRRNAWRNFYVKKAGEKNDVRPLAGHGFINPAESSNSAMSSIWLQIILRAGDVRINSFVELLYLTNYIEAVNKRIKAGGRYQ